jgi:hypothetical protein
MVEPVTVPCLECDVGLAGDSPELRLEVTCDDEPIVYCSECWERTVATLMPTRASRLLCGE